MRIRALRYPIRCGLRATARERISIRPSDPQSEMQVRPGTVAGTRGSRDLLPARYLLPHAHHDRIQLQMAVQRGGAVVIVDSHVVPASTAAGIAKTPVIGAPVIGSSDSAAGGCHDGGSQRKRKIRARMAVVTNAATRVVPATSARVVVEAVVDANIRIERTTKLDGMAWGREYHRGEGEEPRP